MFGRRKVDTVPVLLERLASLEGEHRALKRDVADLDARVQRWIRRERSQDSAPQADRAAPDSLPHVANGLSLVAARRLKRLEERRAAQLAASSQQAP